MSESEESLKFEQCDELPTFPYNTFYKNKKRKTSNYDLKKLVETVADKSSNTIHENNISFIGDLLGFLGSYIFCCCCSCYQTVPPEHEIIITRFGNFHLLDKSGIHYVRPLTDTYAIIPLTIQSINIPKQNVYTKEYAHMIIDGSIHYHVVDSYASVIIPDIESKLLQIIPTAVRNSFILFTLIECLTQENQITDNIKYQIELLIKGWGIQLKQVLINKFEHKTPVINVIQKS